MKGLAGRLGGFAIVSFSSSNRGWKAFAAVLLPLVMIVFLAATGGFVSAVSAQYEEYGGGSAQYGEYGEPPTEPPSLALASLAVYSPTHPDVNAWYPDNDPVFAWSAEIPTVVDSRPSAGHENAATEAYAVSGNYAYVAESGNLTITDISNPESPVLAGSYALGGGNYALTLSGNYAYVAETRYSFCWDCGGPWDTWYTFETISLLKIDVANPAAPTLAGSFSTTTVYYGGGHGGDGNPHVGVGGDYVYFGGYGRFFLGNIKSHHVSYVLDQSPDTVPDNIPEDNSTSVTYSDIADGEYYFHVAAVEGSELGPVSHRRVGIDSTCGQKPDLALRNSKIYWASYADYMDRELSADYLLSNNRASAAANVYLSGAIASNGVMVCETGNCDPKIALIGSYDTPGHAHGVAVAGAYAYIADWQAGLQIIDISNPASPLLAGSLGTYQAEAVVLQGQYAYLADSNAGLKIVDVSNPESPVLAGAGDFDSYGYAVDVAVSKHYAYVADANQGLQIIDISNPASPVLAGSYEPENRGIVSRVAVNGNHVFLATEYDGLQIVDVSDPARPTLIGSYPTGFSAIRGNYAYGSGNSGFQIIDVSNPASPTLVGSYNAPFGSVTLSGNYAYLASGWPDYELNILDVSNPVNPRLINSFKTGYGVSEVAVNGDYAYMAKGYSGLQIITNLLGKPLFPYTIGNLMPGESRPFTVKFKVPQGVNRFSTRFSGYGEDRCGNAYAYGGS